MNNKNKNNDYRGCSSNNMIFKFLNYRRWIQDLYNNNNKK